MRRKALLIGNTHGLPGVKIDLYAVSAFLKSLEGGAWFDSEIQTLLNADKRLLMSEINAIKQEKHDYVIVHYSGHGGQELQTILEINSKGECIYESDLFNMASRQVCIFDCCRAYPQPAVASLSLNKAFAFESLDDSVSYVRRSYENRIMKSIPQQILMYGCAKGQSALDTSEGGIYTSSLLKMALKCDSTEPFKTVGTAHQEASGVVENLARARGTLQTPEIILPRCLSSQQLIISLNIANGYLLVG